MSNIYIIKMSEGADTAKKSYRISNLGDFNWDVRTPVSPMPLPEENHEENILVKMEGNSASGNISWKIMEGENNHGTYNINNNQFTEGSTGTTAAKQIREWRDEFVPMSVKDRYRIVIQDDSNVVELQDDGTIGGVTFRIDSASPVVWTVQLAFFVGNVVTIFEADVPERPSKVALTGGSGSISVSWNTSTSYADSSDAPTITGAHIRYKKEGDIWKDAGAASSNKYALGHGGENGAPSASTSTTFTINNTSEGTALSAGQYKVKVANLCDISDESAVFLYRTGEDSNDKWVTVS